MKIFLALISISLIGLTLASAPEFCWRESYERGVGIIPSECGSGEKIGTYCFSSCPSGTRRYGYDCHSVCPQDLRDDGLFCKTSEYSRGQGYARQFTDGIGDKGMFGRCEKENGVGNCEKYGLVVYKKCLPGYSPTGCCICRPKVPNCAALGLNPGVDLSCAKKILIGEPYLPNCLANKQKNAGLCYNACRAGFLGVGPVCLSEPPTGWVACGLGAAVNSKVCSENANSQAAIAGAIALSLVSLGTRTATAEYQKNSRQAQVSAEFQNLKSIFDSKALENLKNISKIRNYYTQLSNSVNSGKKDDVTMEEISRLSAEIAASISLSSTSDLSSINFPRCTVSNRRKVSNLFRRTKN